MNKIEKDWKKLKKVESVRKIGKRLKSSIAFNGTLNEVEKLKALKNWKIVER